MDILRHDDRDFRLQRFPLRHDDPLRAWDAADAYLLREFGEPTPGGTLLINDTFGALGVALHDRRPTSWSDSHLGLLALRHNLALNDLDTGAVTFVPADAVPEGPFGLVLARLPKSLAFWEDTLLRLRPLLHPGSRVIAGGMIKHSPGRAYKLMEEILGPTRTSLGWKKARLATAAFDPEFRCAERVPDTEYLLDGFDVMLRSGPNVFAREHLDIGTRFLLPHLPRSDMPRRIADVGCGNGALTVALARLNPRAEILAVDESYQAVASARANVERAGVPDGAVEFAVADGLTETAADALDLVVVNPPFHQSHAVGDQLAWRMFTHTKRTLVLGGRLLVVSNRHLGHHVRLLRIFGNCRTVETGAKFVVLESEKRAE